MKRIEPALHLTRLHKLAFAKELNQLAKYQKRDPIHSDWWQQRTAEQKQAIFATSASTCVTKLCNDSISRINIFRNAAHWLMIHPANVLHHGFLRDELAKDLESLLQKEIIDTGHGERCSFLADDQVFLDGLLLKPNPKQPAKDVLLIGLPNSMNYEKFIKVILEKHRGDFYTNRCDIFLYNDKGIGRSLGCTYSLEDNIKAAVSALDFLQQKDYENIHVAGISLGGGVMAQALKRHTAAQKTTKKNIQSFTLVHSFSSLYSCINSLFSTRLIDVHFVNTDKTLQESINKHQVPTAIIDIPISINDQHEWLKDIYACTLGALFGVINIIFYLPALAVSLLLRLAGVRVLNSAAVLDNPNLPAEKIEIINCDNDKVVQPIAQIRKNPAKDNIEIINNPDSSGHFDWSLFLTKFFKEHANKA